MANRSRWVSISLLVLLQSCGGDGAGTGQSGASGKPIDLSTASGVQVVLLPGGTFTMGNNAGDKDEQPEHAVEIAPLVMDKFEVTHELFDKAQLPNPSKWKDEPRKPVNQVRWRDAKQYCNERSLLEGLEPCYDEKKAGWPCDFSATGYRLPTEAEWEYAAKAGTNKVYDFGSVSNLGRYAVFGENSGSRTHPAGSKRPNTWGLFDLYGNVSEWCQDAYDPTYYSSAPGANPRGPDSMDPTAKRVIRGGSWKSTANMCRNTFRQGQTTGDTDACFSTDFCGFRCVRAPSQEELKLLSPSSG